MNKPHGIIVFGANGSGKSTLGRELARVLNFKFMDIEDYHFEKSEIPYTVERSPEDCLNLMHADMEKYNSFVLSAVTGDFGEEISSMYVLAVFMSAPIETRMERIGQREYEKHGERIRKGGDMYEQHLSFINFARSRNLSNIDRWADKLLCPIILVDGTQDYRQTAADIATRFYKNNALAQPAHETDEERRARIYPVILNEYNPAWPKWFTEEEKNLKRLIGVENIARISHFGSTSVPGLMAKPTIDILLEISETTDISKLITSLPSPEYFYLNEETLTMPTPPPHLMFLKGYLPVGFAEKVYHIHVRHLGDPDELYFRDYLIAHPETTTEYATLKGKLHKDFEHDRDGYTKAKTVFIRKVTEKARKDTTR